MALIGRCVACGATSEQKKQCLGRCAWQWTEVIINLYCNSCGESKDEGEFNRDNSKPTGRQSICRSCTKTRHRVYRYGLDKASFESLLAAHGNSCAVCHVQFSEEIQVVVDHDHSCCTGRTTCGRCVRGLLCHHCNSLIGMAEDDPEILESAIKYLTREVL